MSTEFTVIRSEPGLWTVGYHTPDGKWEPESDHHSASEAGRRADRLNGNGDGHVYLRSEPGLWTVGFYWSSGRWDPVSDHASADEAAQVCAELNGSEVDR